MNHPMRSRVFFTPAVIAVLLAELLVVGSPASAFHTNHLAAGQQITLADNLEAAGNALGLLPFLPAVGTPVRLATKAAAHADDVVSAATHVRGAARDAAAAARQLGRAGETAVRAAYDIGPREAIKIGGRTRIPDGINWEAKTLAEVKNVQSLSYTSQLRDYAAYARQEGLMFNLYVRPGAKLSQPLLDARAAKHVNILEIP